MKQEAKIKTFDLYRIVKAPVLAPENASPSAMSYKVALTLLTTHPHILQLRDWGVN